ncbi:MAG: hypothetical protein L0Y56_05945 [Nitrospira sp.]|nr:hypothetical protein [Nitrospira sp.]
MRQQRSSKVLTLGQVLFQISLVIFLITPNHSALGLIVPPSDSSLCPSGTEIVGSQQSGEQWCQKQDKTGNFVKHGPYTAWYPNGLKRAEGVYNDGKMQGLWTLWHDNGQKLMVANFREGKLDGLYTYWYKDGKKGN